LKNQIQNYKELLNEKEEEISGLKSNIKISKFISLENEFTQMKEDYNRLQDQYVILNQNYNEYLIFYYLFYLFYLY